jgi:hypothetical protein
MKKLIALLFLVFFITGTVIAQDWWVKPSAGVLLATVDDKIVLDSDSNLGTLEGYEGGAGTEIRVSVGNNMIETSYILQYYTADKDGSITVSGTQFDEKGDITFVNEMIDVATYLFDQSVKTGFNFSVGLGTGVSKITLTDRVIGTTAYADYAIYAKIYHYRGSVHYDITEMFGAEFTYRSQNINVAGESSFNNTTMSLLANVKF